MFYIQDAWKATPDLTINYGVRYEYFTPIIERNDLTSNFDPDANGGRGALITAIHWMLEGVWIWKRGGLGAEMELTQPQLAANAWTEMGRFKGIVLL